ncbi:hypothetical protein CCR91_12195 [Thiorhodovibrio winogradskyi]|nr:hypothetical protein [Thiorhodovibrio winogradskyi]
MDPGGSQRRTLLPYQTGAARVCCALCRADGDGTGGAAAVTGAGAGGPGR